jgi:hypothetical protein
MKKEVNHTSRNEAAAEKIMIETTGTPWTYSATRVTAREK